MPPTTTTVLQLVAPVSVVVVVVAARTLFLVFEHYTTDRSYIELELEFVRACVGPAVRSFARSFVGCFARSLARVPVRSFVVCSCAVLTTKERTPSSHVVAPPCAAEPGWCHVIAQNHSAWLVVDTRQRDWGLSIVTEQSGRPCPIQTSARTL